MFCRYPSQSEKFADLMYEDKHLLEPKSVEELIDTSETFKTFESFIGCSSLLINAFNDCGDSHNLIYAIENYIQRPLTETELQRLALKCNAYSLFYQFKLPNIILDIEYNETKPKSKEDCRVLLNEYILREPSTDEVNTLWCHAESLNDSEWHYKC